jgi:hypothetical protein
VDGWERLHARSRRKASTHPSLGTRNSTNKPQGFCGDQSCRTIQNGWRPPELCNLEPRLATRCPRATNPSSLVFVSDGSTYNYRSYRVLPSCQATRGKIFIGRHSPRSCRARPGSPAPREWSPIKPHFQYMRVSAIHEAMHAFNARKRPISRRRYRSGHPTSFAMPRRPKSGRLITSRRRGSFWDIRPP